MVMESPVRRKTLVDIKAVMKKHHNIIPTMLTGNAAAAAAAATYYGIRMVEMWNILKRGVSSLELTGTAEVEWPHVLEQATKFTGACCGQTKAKYMSEAEVKVWTEKVGKRGTTNTLH